MKRTSWLDRLAIAVWLAWLGLVGLLFAMLRLGAWHPHFLPVTAVLVVLLAAGISLLIGGLWRLITRTAAAARAGVPAAWPAAAGLPGRAPDVWLRHGLRPPAQR